MKDQFIRSYGLIFFSFILLLCQNSLAETNPTPVFELTHTSRGDTSFFIKIYPDGNVHFHDNTSVAMGDHYAKITPEQLNTFTMMFLSLPFELPKQYERKKGGVPWRSTITYNDDYINMKITDSIFFQILESRLAKLINLKQWLCFPKDHPEYSEDCLKDKWPENRDELKYFLEH